MLTRSALVGIIHDQTIHLPSVAHDTGAATTLVSTDAEELDGVPEMFHETWAQILEVVIGVVLLSREVGWIWPLPLILIFCGFSQSFQVCILYMIADTNGTVL